MRSCLSSLALRFRQGEVQEVFRALLLYLLQATTLLYGKEKFNRITIDHREETGLSQQFVTRILMRASANAATGCDLANLRTGPHSRD